MKNINKLNIENWNYKSLVEYLILKWEASQTLESLWQPETANQAKENIKDIINKENKYKNFIPIEGDVLFKILFEALSTDRSIENQLSIFLRQMSSKIAWTRVKTWFIVWEIANNTYIKQTPFSNVFDKAA